MSKTIKNSKKSTTPTSKIGKLEAYLKNGGAVTEKLAVSRFGLKNLRATISDLRERGMIIDTKTNNSGYLSYTKKGR